MGRHLLPVSSNFSSAKASSASLTTWSSEMLDYFTPCWHDNELTMSWKAWSRPKGKCCPGSEEMGGTHKRDDSLMCRCYDCERGAVWSVCGKTSRRSRREGRERRSFLLWFLRDRKVHGGCVAIDSIIHNQIHQLMEGVNVQNKLSLHPKSPAASDKSSSQYLSVGGSIRAGRTKNRLCLSNLWKRFLRLFIFTVAKS